MKFLLLIIPLIYICCSPSDKKTATYPDCSSNDIEKMDTCLLGIPLRNAIEKLKIDTSQFFAFDEPPRILRGIKIQLGDTCQIELYVDRTSLVNKQDSLKFREEYLHIINKKVIGVYWEKEKRNKSKELSLSVPDPD